MGGERESASASCPSRTAGLARSRSPPAGRVQCEGSGRLPAGRPADGRARCLHLPMNFRSEAPPNFLRGAGRGGRGERGRRGGCWRAAARPAGSSASAAAAWKGADERARAINGGKRRSTPPSTAGGRSATATASIWPTDRPTTLSLSLSVQSTTRTTLARCGLEIPTTEFVVLVRSAIARRGKERRQLQMENGRKEEEGI